MAKVKGIDFLLSVDTSATEVPSYTAVAGQRSATLNRSAETLDATSKDTDGWKESEVGFMEWSIEADGIFTTDQAGFTALEDAFMSREKVQVQLAMPSGAAYSGFAFITDFPIEAPYDDMATYSITLQGTGILS